MWIPHFGFTPWQNENTDNDQIKKSNEDKSIRYFYVAFHLENCDARKINDSTVALDKDEFSIVKNGDDTVVIEMKLKKNDQNRLARIETRLKRDNFLVALHDSYNILTSYLLSIQSFQSGANFGIWAISIKDDLHKAEWVCKPQSPKAEPLRLPGSVDISNEFKALFALYREGKNNRSPYYRFFCFYKILEAFYTRSDIFRKMDKIINEKKLEIKRPRRRIKKDDLVYSLLNTTSKYMGMTYGEFFKELRSNERLMMAHSFPKDKPFINIDNFDLFKEYATIGNLTDLVSRQLLLDELDIQSEMLKIVEKSKKTGPESQ